MLAINLTVRIFEKFRVRVNVQSIFENSSISELSNFILHLDTSTENINSIVKAKEKELYHLSSAQRRIYYSTKIAGDDTILYNIPGAIILDKKPDSEKLNKCFEKLIQKHLSLRTCFIEAEEDVYQKVSPSVCFKIDEMEDSSKSLDQIMKDFVRPFDLSKAPLLHVGLVKNKDKYLLLFDIHHIICDGASLSIFITELEKLYNGGVLPVSYLDYIDFAEWEFEQLNKDDMNQNHDFWINQFRNNTPVLDFPTDYVRPSIQSFEGAKVYKALDLKLSQEINNLARKLDVSTFMLLLSFFYILLFKYSNQEDIVCGTPSACRDREELLNMIGMFVNTLPLKNHIDDSMNFKDFLKTVKANCIKAFDRQTYPFDELVKNLDIEKDTSRNPLFQVMFIYQNNGITPMSFDGIKTSMYIPDTGISKFDLSLEVVPQSDNTFSFTFEYCTNLFKNDTIERLANNFINIIKKVLDNCDKKISDIDILSEEEKNKILCKFNNTKMEYPKDKTIIQMFEEQVQKTPDRIAIVFEGKALTFKELNIKANHLAWYLRNNGLKRNDIISIMVNRSLELLIAIIAVLKSGACYIPIDPSYPKDRTEYMLKNSHCKLLLTSSSLLDKIDFENKIAVNLTESYFVDNDNNLPSISEPEDTSYIIYTSGSTGLPKGVVLKQQSLTNLTYHLNDYVKFLKDDVYIAIASVTTASFDIFIFESLIALQKGLKVVIADEEEQRLPSRLNSLIGNNDIKAIQMTPSRMRLFVDNIEECPNLSNLDYVVLAGEPLPDSLLKDLLHLGVKKVYNGYGPSETTVFSTFTDVTDYETVNIGRPLSNTQMYILDKNFAPVPIDIPGELYIAGDGVGKGYLNNEKITNERFISNPFNPGSFMYKTGDVCKFLDNGEIVYIERADNQVKIRGLRIELEEIEAKLLQIPNIKKAKVVKQTIKNRDFISAYYVGNKALDQKEIRKILSDSLPNYMVPSYFTLLDDFPYTPNGKIDKNALPLPNSLAVTQTNTYTAPRNNIEIQLTKILESILNTSHISISDDFYSLGGDSLTTIALCTRVKQAFNTELSFKDVMLNPTIEGLAAIIANAEKCSVKTSCIEKCLTQEYYLTSSAQKRTYLASLMDPNSTLYNISGSILLATSPDIEKLQNAISVVISRHEALRTYFEVVNGQIVQKIIDNLNVNLDIQDVNTNDPDELLCIYQSIFKLNKCPLFNVVLFKLPNGKALLMLDIHHIIFDGASLNNFIQELSAAYNGNDLPKLDISYKDFAVWENNKLNSNGFENSRKFWHEQFSDYIPVLNLPTVFPRPKIKSYEGKVYNTSLSKWFVEKINIIASEYKVTPFMVLLSSYYILLNKYSNNENIVIGTPASGRLYKELEPLLGMFVNSIPLRNTISPNMSFEEFLQEVKSTCINAFAHQDYPFDVLVNDLKITKDSSRNLLFDTMFIFQNNGIDAINFGGIKGTFVPPTNHSAKFDISLEVLPNKDTLFLSFEYCTKLFDEIFIGNFAKAYENILVAVLENPKILIDNIAITKDNQSNKISYKFNKIDLESKENVGLFEKEITSPDFTFSENNDNLPVEASANIISDFTSLTVYDTISEENYIAPRNNIETQVANAFESLLSISNISIDDNFFELGGDSLVAINLQIELMKQNFNVTYADIFANPTIRTLSEKLSLDEGSSINTTNADEFTEINKILENTINMPNKINYQELDDILLTGATGFLGIHILENFLKNKGGKAYCLVRPDKTHRPVEKFREKLHYYFGTKYDELIGDRIIIINSDISKENLGLSDTDLLAVASHVSCVINSAAKVAHYGNYSSFEKINVYGTKNLLDFCLKFNKRFYQISTLSVSGNTVVEQSFENDVIFRENNLYIGQTLDNVYVKSKFEAEKLVLKYVAKGLNGYILRVGNLMNRYSDAKFQPNVQENAYVSMLASLLNIKCIPEYLLERYLEFTPIDICADAIIKIIEHPCTENRVFHLYDYNHVDIGDFIDIVKRRITFDIVSSDDFVDKINKILKEDDAERILSGILRDLDSNKRLTFETKIKIKSEFSIEYLQKIGFVWPKIDEVYLNRFLDYFESIGYMNFKGDK